jgi:hypothetical protein
MEIMGHFLLIYWLTLSLMFDSSRGPKFYGRKKKSREVVEERWTLRAHVQKFKM